MKVRFVDCDNSLDEGLMDAFGKAKSVIFSKLGVEPKITKGNFYQTFEDTLFASLVKKGNLDREQQESLKKKMPEIMAKIRKNAKVKLALSNVKTISANEGMLLDESVTETVENTIIGAIATVGAIVWTVLEVLKFAISKSVLLVVVGLSFIVSLVAFAGSLAFGFLKGLIDTVLALKAMW